MATRSLGQLTLDLIARVGGFEAGLDKAGRAAKKKTSEIERDFKKLATAAAASAAAAATGIGLLVKSSIDAADSLNDLSKQSGISVESLSGLGYAAKLSGTDMNSLAAGMKKLATNAFDAAKGAKAPAEAFSQLGIEVKKADGTLRSTEELLLDVADVFSQYEDGAAKAAIAQDLFGKSGVELIPFLNAGRDGIKELTDEAKRLGVVVSTETAQAADEFNDSIERLRSRMAGFGNQLAQELLPTLQAIATALEQTADSGTTFGDAMTGLASFGLKSLVDVGSRVVETFEDLGNAIGAVAAAAVALATGKFREAYSIISEASADAAKREAEYTEFRKKLWDDAGKQIVETAKNTDEAIKKTLAFGGKGDGGLQEIAITAKSIDKSPMEEFYERLDRLTQTSTERAIAAYEEQKAALVALYDAGRISAEQYAARHQEALDAFLPEFQVTAKKIKETAEEVAEETNSFFVAAAEGTQGILADTLFDGLDGKFEDIGQQFKRMIDRMVAEALAAQLATKLFGEDYGKGKTGGLIGAGLNWLGGLFGGGRANGGPVSAGTLYEVNETGREYFRPSTSGEVIPLSKMPTPRGNSTVIVNVRGDVNQRTATQLANEATRRQRLAARLV